MTTSQSTQGTRTAALQESRYGGPQPQIELRMPRGTHFRRLNALLYQLAAEAELATPAGEGWVVQTEACSDSTGRVYLELAGGSPAEAERAMTMLRKLAR